MGVFTAYGNENGSGQKRQAVPCGRFQVKTALQETKARFRLAGTRKGKSAGFTPGFAKNSPRYMASAAQLHLPAYQ